MFQTGVTTECLPIHVIHCYLSSLSSRLLNIHVVYLDCKFFLKNKKKNLALNETHHRLSTI